MNATSGSSIARKTTVGASWMIGWRMVTRLLGLISTIVLARILVPADFGLVAMASTVAFAVEALSQVGVQEALIRRPEEGRELYDAAFAIQIGRALLTAAVIAIGAPLAGWWFAEPRLVPVLLILAALNFVSGFENIGIVELRREMRFDRQFLLLSFPRLLQVVTTISAALLLRTYWALLFGIAVGKLVRLGATYVVHPYRPSFRIEGWRELAGYSFWTWASSVVKVGWDRSDPVILGPVLGAARLGSFLVAAEIAILPISELIAPAADALFSGFSSAQKRGTDIVASAMPVAVALLVVVAPLTVAISASAHDIVAALLGPKWIEAGPLVAILAWVCLCSPFSYVASTVLVARGQVRLNFLGNLAAAFFKVAGLLIAVSATSNLIAISVVGTAIVAAESAAFMCLLMRAGGKMDRSTNLGLLRIALATSATVLVLAVSGLGWQSARTEGLPALMHGAFIGVATLAAYAVIVVLLWILGNRPQGPEATLIRVARQFSGPLFRKGSHQSLATEQIDE